MGTEPQMFAKEDLNLNRKHLEQLDKLDVDFNQKIVKVGRAKDTISNVMQQFVGILENLAQAPGHYSQFQPNSVQHDQFLHLHIQENYFNNSVNHNK